MIFAISLGFNDKCISMFSGFMRSENFAFATNFLKGFKRKDFWRDLYLAVSNFKKNDKNNCLAGGFTTIFEE